MSIIAVFGRNDDASDAWSFSGFVTQSTRVVEPGSGIATPRNESFLRDIPRAIAVGEFVTGSHLPFGGAPAGDVGCGAAGRCGILSPIEKSVRLRGFFASVGDNDFFSDFEATVCRKFIEGDDAVSVSLVFFGDAFDAVSFGNDVLQSRDRENENLIAGTYFIDIIEIVRPENGIGGDGVFCGDATHGVTLFYGIYFDAAFFFRILLYNRRKIGRSENAAWSRYI